VDFLWDGKMPKKGAINNKPKSIVEMNIGEALNVKINIFCTFNYFVKKAHWANEEAEYCMKKKNCPFCEKAAVLRQQSLLLCD
jgi:hypothetical protein